MNYKLHIISNARYFGIKIHGSDNISKIRKYVHGLNGIELSGITLNGKGFRGEAGVEEGVHGAVKDAHGLYN